VNDAVGAAAAVHDDYVAAAVEGDDASGPIPPSDEEAHWHFYYGRDHYPHYHYSNF
jgi:hypothetical protein